jgi:hypothetical protein
MVEFVARDYATKLSAFHRQLACCGSNNAGRVEYLSEFNGFSVLESPEVSDGYVGDLIRFPVSPTTATKHGDPIAVPTKISGVQWIMAHSLTRPDRYSSASSRELRVFANASPWASWPKLFNLISG